MEPKNRRLLVIAIAITLVIGVMTSFGLPFFAQTPRIVLSDGEENPGAAQGSGAFDPESVYVPISVTTDTVQAVVASMERSNSYYRRISIERWGSGESPATTAIQIWKNDRFERVTLLMSDSTSKNFLTDGTNIHIWFSGDRTYRSYPATQEQIDLMQEIPTYELVGEMEPESITDAYYDMRDGENCICIEYQTSVPGFVERCWVSVDTGLLFAVEQSRESDAAVKYRMSQTSIEFNMDEKLALDANLFTLPDGTKLD